MQPRQGAECFYGAEQGRSRRLGSWPWLGGIVDCEICGQSHVHHTPKQKYRAVEIASDPITHERWMQVPNGTVFAVDPDYRLHILPLSSTAISAAEGAETLDERL